MEGYGKKGVVLSLILIFSICIYSGVFATHTLSDYSVSTTDGDILTPNNIQESFNFSITSNTSSSHSIVEINITNANFTTLNNGSFNESCNISAWGFYNFTDYVIFNTISGNITNGSSCWFAFNATPGISQTGDNISQNWTVKTIDNNTDSTTNYLFTYVDSMAPMVNRINLTYDGTNVAGGSITERKNITIEVNVTDYGYGVNTSNVSAKITNSSDDLVNELALSNAGGDIYSGVWEAATSNTGSGKYNINISVSDLGGNSNTSANSTTLTLNAAPDFTVTNLTWNSSNANPMHPNSNDNIMINATLENQGDENASGNIIVSIYLDGVLKVNNTISNESLEPGETNYTVFTLESGNFSSNTEYNFTVKIDPFNSINETFENNNTDTILVSLGYNITIASISPTSINVSENITVSIYVNYTNGDPVDNLTVYNITLLDKHSGATVDTWDDADALFNSTFNASENASGYYSFNITSYYVYNIPRPGTHNLSVTASRGNYSGTSLGLDYYFLTVPDFSIQISGLVSTLQEGNVDTFTVTVKNIGNSTAYTVKVYPVDLSYVGITPATSPLYTMSSGSQKNSGLSLTASSVSDNLIGSFRLRVSAISSNGSVFNATSSLFTIIVTDSAATDGDGLLDGGGTTGCTTDANCLSGYYCSGGLCYPKQYAISITSYQSLVKANWSSYVTAEVTVKNTGQQAMTGKLTVTMSGMNITVLPSSFSMDPDVSSIFVVNISVPETAVLGNHSGTFKAYVNENTNVYQTKTFTLTVLSTPEKEEEINETYQNYSAIFEDLEERFARLKAIGFINESNLTEVELLLNASMQSMNNLKEALDEFDYESADLLLETINTSLSNLGSEIESLELEQQEMMGGELSGIWLWVVIGVVVVIVAGFLVYLLMPSFRGYHPRYGYRPVIKESFFEKISKMFSRKPKKKKEFKEPEKPREYKPAYSEGYKKVSSEYRYKRGTFSKIKEKLKRKKKQKEVSEFFGSK